MLKYVHFVTNYLLDSDVIITIAGIPQFYPDTATEVTDAYRNYNERYVQLLPFKRIGSSSACKIEYIFEKK